VLVTTRRRDLARYPHISLPLLTDDEGLSLLNGGDRQFGSEAKALVEDVGGLPLALELLRGWLERRRDVEIAALRRSLRESGEMNLLRKFAEDYGDELPTAHERNVAATFQMSWDLASADGNSVLRVMAHLAPTPVPLRLLRKTLGWEESAGIGDRLAEAIADLWRLSLVERDDRHQPSAHRLILAFVRSLPDPDTWRTATVAAVEKEMNRTNDERDTASSKELEAVVPHAEAILARADLPDERRIEIAGDLGYHHKALGRYQLSLPFVRSALESATRSLPPGNPGIAAWQSNLAVMLQDLGELKEARDLHRKALAAIEPSLPPGDLSVAIAQSNLAAVLKDLGELKEARDLLGEALATHEQRLPPGHPKIAIIQSNLALVLRDLGELPEARDLLRKALAANEQSLPPGHPNIAIIQSNLATVLQGLGELPEARDLLRKALAADELSFSQGHPKIAIRQSNLAMVLKDLGELPEARELLQKAYASSLAQLGPEHPQTRTILENLQSLPKNAL
jgi:tetratricopeptide (TPR) repeat protein